MDTRTTPAVTAPATSTAGPATPVSPFREKVESGQFVLTVEVTRRMD